MSDNPLLHLTLLTAAATEVVPEDQHLYLAETRRLASRLAAQLRQATEDFFQANPSATAEEWTAFLNKELREPLSRDARKYATSLRLSGFKLSKSDIDEIVQEAVQATLKNVDDVRLTYRTATDKQGILAAGGRWDVSALLRNVDQLVLSLIRVVRSRTGDAAFTRQQIVQVGQELGTLPGGFTGRRMLVDSRKGRRSAIHLQVEDSPGSGWVVPARPDLGIGEYHFDRLFQSIETRVGATRWSGSRSVIRFERINPDGSIEFIGPRGGRYDIDGHPIRGPKPSEPGSPFFPF